ncbi:MAG: MarR family transcriptional regulator [Deltaproteobacteria bacterium]|nr:MarR family transcriptional regulator [Deltaproteobacteria bacterium]
MDQGILDARIKEILWLIRRLSHAGAMYNRELIRNYSVSAPQLSCLLALDEYGPMSPSRIARRIMVNSSTVTGIIDRLEQQGMVERMRISTDRRVITITLTGGGKSLVDNTPPPIQKKFLRGLKGLSLKEIDRIVDSLVKIAHILEAGDGAGKEKGHEEGILPEAHLW